ncbi:unnamed protein product [Amoebophrya sp. A25]|nr:unnamed protein product [Amoebophrya sp. A25]|eukprot:GSA25T00005402001.1
MNFPSAYDLCLFPEYFILGTLSYEMKECFLYVRGTSFGFLADLTSKSPPVNNLHQSRTKRRVPNSRTFFLNQKEITTRDILKIHDTNSHDDDQHRIGIREICLLAGVCRVVLGGC